MPISTAAEMRKRAIECRLVADRLPLGARRDQFIKMTEVWEDFARERLRENDAGQQESGSAIDRGDEVS
jgi:hypothetical protein